MKKFMKGCAITALVLIILGFVLAMAAGTTAGANTISQVVDNVTGGNVQVKLDSIRDWGITVGDSIVDSLGGIEVNYNISDATNFDDDYEILKGDVEKYCPGEGIERLDIEVGGCTFDTKVSGDDKFYLEVKSAHKFQGYVKDSTLYIKATVGTTKLDELDDFVITLYLPEKSSLEEADVEIGAGIVAFSDLAIEKASFDVGAGQLTIKGVQAAELSLSVGAGQINISDMEVAVLDVEVGMGECVAEGAVTKSADVECAMGNVDLKVMGSEEDFNYQLEGAMGNIDLGSRSFSGVAQEQNISNGAEKNMNVECAMGNITIRFTN